ncbi:MAG: hypothetical protein K9K75_01780 [Deltaproteobacteria bacterium]|nr:hypothetical protein [Deltaproteobacteria bacterium]
MIEKMGSIEILSKGAEGNSIAKEISNDKILAKTDKYDLVLSNAKSIGIVETLCVTVGGAVASHFIIRLIEKILDLRNQKDYKVKIEIYHVDLNITHMLPEEKAECIEFYDQITSKEK